MLKKTTFNLKETCSYISISFLCQVNTKLMLTIAEMNFYLNTEILSLSLMSTTNGYESKPIDMRIHENGADAER